jgi:hypothetical protein
MESTKYQNVFQRISDKRRNYRDGKADACYYFTYRHQETHIAPHLADKPLADIKRYHIRRPHPPRFLTNGGGV